MSRPAPARARWTAAVAFAAARLRRDWPTVAFAAARLRRDWPTLFVAATLAAAAIAYGGPAAATECDPASGISPCIDSNPLWIAPGNARFLSVASAAPLRVRAYSFGLALTYLDRPIVLRAPSPDPEGRDVNVVRDAVDMNLLFARGVLPRLEIGAALPTVLYQRGAGVEGATHQRSLALNTSALRDPRVGASWSLLEPARQGLGAKARLELTLPFGHEDRLAGERTLAAAPGVAFELNLDRFHAGLELGARLRETREFSGTRFGSQARVAFALGFDVLGEELLSVGAETWALPVLVDQNHDLPNGGTVRSTILVPAEALLSLRSAPTSKLVLQLGGGLGIPISSERRVLADGSESTEYYAGMTAARFRVVFVARYATDPVPDRTTRNTRDPRR